MSLYKQLWAAVLLLLTVVFSISFVVTTLSARAYLEQQLSLKNADNAAALALSLTQQGADSVLLELTLAAQFDTGHYELIKLTDPRGSIAIHRQDEQAPSSAPAWFVTLFPIDVQPGIATIQAGWQQAGTLTVRSHSRFAYEELWRNTLLLALVFLAAGVFAGVAGSLLLKRILLPLADVVNQAQAIGERRFITMEEPRTREFRQVAGAMNALSTRIQGMLAQETRRLEKLQRAIRIDPATGLLRREAFLVGIDAILLGDDANASGTLSVVRVETLVDLNNRYGREAVDTFLQSAGDAINRLVEQNVGWTAGRMNGSEFALLAPRELEAEDTARLVQDLVVNALQEHGMSGDTQLPTAAVLYHHGDIPSELLMKVDGALTAAAIEPAGLVVDLAIEPPMQSVRQQMEHWRAVVERALREDSFSLATYPVVDPAGELIHFESPVRLDRQEESWSAGQFLPWIHRLQLAGDLDRKVVELALAEIAERNVPLAINLSVASVWDESFSHWIDERMRNAQHTRSRLWVDIPESVAMRHMDNFRYLCARLKQLDVRVSIKHMGHHLTALGQLHDIGLDAMKVDAAFVRELQNSPGNQTLIRTLCTLGHTIGVLVIAEGVRDDRELAALKELGVDGATGPGVRLYA
ncbi:MAG: EAL domain-containing protein [Pseudomonadota bacterium]